MKSLSPHEIADLLREGVPYLDVRTVNEFNRGHVPGSVNIPFQLESPDGMVENSEFGRVVRSTFPGTAPLIIGCRSGVRSKAACAVLETLGYTTLYELDSGFEGKKDPFGRGIPGWRGSDLPIENECREEQRYSARLAAARP